MEAVRAIPQNLTMFINQGSQHLEPSCILLLTLIGKVLLNLFVFGSERKSVKGSFLRYFSVSIALADFVLLLTVSFISYFQDLAIWGIRFTKYHICLFTQIASFTYGVMHYPAFFVAGLDYCIVKTSNSKFSGVFRRLLYFAGVVVLWVATLYYVLTSPAICPSLEIKSYFSYQCPFYISIQSYRLSLMILFFIGLVLVICWFEVITLLQSLRMISYINEKVMLFSFAPSCHQTTRCKKRLLTSYLICFLGAWLPFVVLQLLLVILNAQIPAYMDMNVPWLYFLNSFLIGAANWLRQSDVDSTDLFSSDPFVSWQYSFNSLVINEHSKQTNKLLEKSVTITIV
ncbi:probable G-protein coupled receptor 160 [Pleurodeles waltl]|uniref:probable G-protein coupled receptor 160 n=1 Tax=Pleurodeles waltl TaxID=8319 RepID=UPI0037096D4A